MSKKTAAEKRLDTIRKKKEATERRNKMIADKRAATIKAKEVAKEKEIKRKSRVKLLESINGTKPIFWVFFLFGWISSLYWLFIIVKFLIKVAMGS